jgi:hypothetical protein
LNAAKIGLGIASVLPGPVGGIANLFSAGTDLAQGDYTGAAFAAGTAVLATVGLGAIGKAFQLARAARIAKTAESTLVDVRNTASIAVDASKAAETTAARATQLEFQFAPQVEQYALRAKEAGFYPVRVRGSEDAQFITLLKKGDVWKFGTTVNPASRYSGTYLQSIGEHGVEYSTEFLGTERQAVQLQNMKILNYRLQKGWLPPGNKVVN